MVCLALSATAQESRSLTAPTTAQEPGSGIGGAQSSAARTVSNDGSCWLQAALPHADAIYTSAIKARGMVSAPRPRPPEERIQDRVANSFPANTGVLIYDYIPPWESSKTYGVGDMVTYLGGVYVSRQDATATAINPKDDANHWREDDSCAMASAESRPVLRVWLVSKSGIEGYAAIPFSPEMLDQALLQFSQSLRFTMAGHRDGSRGADIVPDPTAAKTLDDALSQLSRLLIPAEFWHAVRKFEQIILVPQLGIAEVPFAMLPDPDGLPLIDTTSVWIARSIGDVAGGGDQHDVLDPDGDGEKAITFDSPLVVGNPMFVSNERLYLPQLPGAEDESKAVSQIMHTTPLLGGEATKKTVESRARTADVLYFATHGAAIPDDPLAGFLALAGAPEEGGRWSAKEIQSMDLSRTNLAVLSACQTGLGGVHPAGIIGVGRAFTLAGVRWVVMSLWNLDDKATSELMQNFIGELASCKSNAACLPAVALRRAMLTEKNLNPDPRVWGPFVVFGVPSGSRLGKH